MKNPWTSQVTRFSEVWKCIRLMIFIWFIVNNSGWWLANDQLPGKRLMNSKKLLIIAEKKECFNSGASIFSCKIKSLFVNWTGPVRGSKAPDQLWSGTHKSRVQPWMQAGSLGHGLFRNKKCWSIYEAKSPKSLMRVKKRVPRKSEILTAILALWPWSPIRNHQSVKFSTASTLQHSSSSSVAR